MKRWLVWSIAVLIVVVGIEFRPTTDAQAADAVTGFNLVAADSGDYLGSLGTGSVLDLSTLQPFSVQAVTEPQEVGSVRFGLGSTANYFTDHGHPYMIQGKSSGKINPWSPPLGVFSIRATPQSVLKKGKGGEGQPLAITIIVIPGDGRVTPTTIPPTMIPPTATTAQVATGVAVATATAQREATRQAEQQTATAVEADDECRLSFALSYEDEDSKLGHLIGEAIFLIDDDGSINGGTFTTEDDDLYALVGQVDGRHFALQLISAQERGPTKGDRYFLSGIAARTARDCRGAIFGSWVGPDLLGGSWTGSVPESRR
jgi:hypothetical protein